MPAPPESPMCRYVLSKSHSRMGQLLTYQVGEARHQSSFLICAHSSCERRAVLMGLASHAYDASSLALFSMLSRCSASLTPRVSQARFLSAVMQRLTASTSDGRVASPSAAMSRSKGW